MNEHFLRDGKKMVIYTYSTKNLKKKDKVRFYYALKGRDGKTGIVKSLQLTHLGKTVLVCPIKHDDEVMQFLKMWNLSYSKRRAIVDTHEEFGGMPS